MRQLLSQAKIYEMVYQSKVKELDRAVRAQGLSFALFPDKEEGWQALLGLTQNLHSDVPGSASLAHYWKNSFVMYAHLVTELMYE